MNKLLKIFFVFVVVGSAFLYRDTLKAVWAQSINHYFPCQTSITYSINSFDTRFDLSKDDFLKALNSAEAIWEKPLSKELFKYDPNGNLKINLIYDSRQESTVQLKKMGVVVDNSKASYDALKEKYDTMRLDYVSQKQILESRISSFESRKKIYESDVANANKRGGANPATYSKLNNEKTYLNQEIDILNKMQNDLNTTVNNLNTLATALNELAASLNIDVKKFNKIGAELGSEFEEGTYRSSAAGQEIDIYQFENQSKLVRVLAHELGHALGLEHIEDPKAIMYRLNNGVNEKLTASDLVELKKLCGIK